MSEYCDECGGYDIEWMHTCSKHETVYCRSCECPECYDEQKERDFDDLLNRMADSRD